MEGEAVFVLLFVVATAVAIAVRRLSVPYTVALVFTGILLGVVRAFDSPQLTQALLFNVFLPGLLFEAAFHIEFDDFWRNRLAVAALAVPGVVTAIALTAVVLPPVAHLAGFAEGLHWQHALVFGALISATDPIAVVAIFRRLGVPGRLSILLEGESLLNDGTAIVFFTLSLAVVSGTAVTASALAIDFVRIVGLGALIGAGVGVLISQIIRQVDDPMIEISLTTIAAYGSFLAAEHFEYSGVIATVVTGLLCGNYAARVGMSPSTRIAVEAFWEYVAFALNSIVFLLIGLEVHFRALLGYWEAILVAAVVVTLGRGFVIAAVTALLARTRERIPWKWTAVLTWGGLRGGLPMVLVLGLPASFPQRDAIVAMTFGVVVISILVSGLTMSPLLRRLGVTTGSAEQTEYELTRSRLQTAHAALEEIAAMARVGFARPDVLAALRKTYEETIARNRTALDRLEPEQHHLRTDEWRRAMRHLLLVEKDRVLESVRRGAMSPAVEEHLLADIDARLLRLEAGEHEPPP
jgi:CPA1 family monovalent cation:H+ antiporter